MRKLYRRTYRSSRISTLWCFSSVSTSDHVPFPLRGSPVRQSATPENAGSAPIFSSIWRLYSLRCGGADSPQGRRARQRRFQQVLAASPVPDAPPAPGECELLSTNRITGRERPASSSNPSVTRSSTALHAGFRQQSANVQRQQPYFPQRGRHFPAQSRQNLDDRRLSLRRPPHQSVVDYSGDGAEYPVMVRIFMLTPRHRRFCRRAPVPSCPDSIFASAIYRPARRWESPDCATGNG